MRHETCLNENGPGRLLGPKIDVIAPELSPRRTIHFMLLQSLPQALLTEASHTESSAQRLDDLVGMSTFHLAQRSSVEVTDPQTH